MNWQKVLNRLSISGLILLVLGAVACTQAKRFDKSERLMNTVRFAGLALAIVGAAVLLDLIPGL